MAQNDRTAVGGPDGTAPRFVIHASEDAPDGQRAALALGPRGTAYRWQKARHSRLSVHHQGETVEADSALAMIELIEQAHPDQPMHPRDPARLALHRELMEAAQSAERRLDSVLAAEGAGDLDLALHFLFRSLEKIEEGIEPPPRADRQPISNLDVMLAPLLWRIVLLDRVALTFILATLPRLGARARWLLNQIEVAEVFDTRATERFVAALRRNRPGSGGAGQDDWSRALGPAGRELRLVPAPRRQA